VVNHFQLQIHLQEKAEFNQIYDYIIYSTKPTESQIEKKKIVLFIKNTHNRISLLKEIQARQILSLSMNEF
jgi:hypothetical protein